MFKLFWSSQFFARGVLDAFKVAVNNVEFAAIHYHHWTRNRFPLVGNHSSCEKRPNSWFSIFYESYIAWDTVCCIHYAGVLAPKTIQRLIMTWSWLLKLQPQVLPWHHSRYQSIRSKLTSYHQWRLQWCTCQLFQLTAKQTQQWHKLL